MRTRTATAAASAALVLCAVLGSAGCSGSSDNTPPSGSSAPAEKEVDPSACATPADKMPEGCEVDIDVSDISEGTPASEGPSLK